MAKTSQAPIHWNTIHRNASDTQNIINFEKGDLADLIAFRCEFENCLWVDWNSTLERRKTLSIQHIGLKIFVSYMNQYGIPSIVSIGCLFNLLAFCVFITNSKFRKSSSAIYFSALATANKGYLIALLIIWLGYHNIRIFHKSGWCQLVLYATFLSSFVSAWSLVCLSWEHYILTINPARGKMAFLRSRAKKVVSGLVMFALMAYSYVLWTTGILYLGTIPSCAPFSKYFTLLRIMTGIDIVLVILLPTVLIIIFNIKTIIYIRKIKSRMKTGNAEDDMRLRFSLQLHQMGRCTSDIDDKPKDLATQNTTYVSSESMLKSSNRTLISSNAENAAILQSGKKFNRREKSDMTVSVLVLTSVYLMLNLPSHSMKVYIYLAKFLRSRHLPLHGASIQEIFQFIYYLNFSLNFIIIFITSANFRKAFGKILMQLVEKLHKIMLSR